MARPIISFTSSADATVFCAQVNSALGYPRAGLNVGRGPWAPPSMAVTDGYEPARSATLVEWGVLNEPEVAAEIGARPPPGLARGTAKNIDENSWFEPRPVKPPKPRPPRGQDAGSR